MNKKILFVNNTFGFFGGVERFVFDTACLLRAHGWQCRGLFEGKSNKTEGYEKPFHSVDIGDCSRKTLEQFSRDGTETAFIHKLTNPKLLEMLTDMFKTVVFVHDHDYYCPRRHKYFPIIRKNCSLAYNRFYCGVCSGLVQKDPAGLFGLKRIDFDKFDRIFKQLKKSDAYIVMSEFMRSNLLLNGFEGSKISKLYPVKKPQKLSFSDGSGEILYVGQLIRGKGVDLLIKAMKDVKAGARLRIVGTGNDEGYIKSLIDKYRLSGKVRLLGWRDDVDSCYNDCDLVVVPSRWQEPFGMIGVEAFSRGKPVVGFDVGGISEWLKDGENGLLVQAGDTGELAAKIERLLSDKQLRDKLGQNGYDMVAGEYSEKAFMIGFDDIMVNLTKETVGKDV